MYVFYVHSLCMKRPEEGIKRGSWDTSNCEFSGVFFGTEPWTSARALTVCNNWTISPAHSRGYGPIFIVLHRRSISHWNLPYWIGLYNSTKNLATTVKLFAYPTRVLPVSSHYYSIVDAQANKHELFYENRVGYLGKPTYSWACKRLLHNQVWKTSKMSSWESHKI